VRRQAAPERRRWTPQVAEQRDPLGTWGAAGRPRRVAAASLAPDRAVRARVNAAVLDGLILGALTLALSAHASADGRVSIAGRTGLLALAAQLVYFTTFETLCGQTIGKRASPARP
jgi:hypothetical protein